MDTTPLVDGLEYQAKLASTALSGDATTKLTKEGIVVSTLLDTAEIPFADINELSFEDHQVVIVTDTDRLVFSQLGSWGQPFFDELHGAYNKAVLDSLFTHGKPLITSEGGYAYREAGVSANGQAPIHVYENCVCVLPTNLAARRVPLHFLTGLDKGDFALTHRVDDDEYTFSKLGYETDPFERTVIARTKALREETQAMVQEIDPTISTGQAAQIAKLMPGGAAASRKALLEVAPSFVEVAEAAIGKSRSGEYYEQLKTLSDPADMHLGFIWTGDASDKEEGGAVPGLEGLPIDLPNITQMLTDVVPAEMGQEQDTDSGSPYLFYAVAPSSDRSKCAVEFAVPENESAATFVYRCDGGADSFIPRINRAMEAVDYARDVISMDEEKLKLPENRRYAMAVKRSSALAQVREGFLGRVIHSSPDTWKRNMEGYFATTA
ncbi:MAG: hypothetical protein FWD41_03545 [Actinomycetia bacterium]|nr:hypothetical protein [Actinomycetes bacterium]